MAQPPERTDEAPDTGDPEERKATGPVVATWRLDDLLWEPAPVPARTAPGPPRRPVYYVSLTAAVMLVLGLLAGLVALALHPPVVLVDGTPTGLTLPELPPPSTSTPPGTPTSAPPPGDYRELAAHPLSSSPDALPEVTCALPTFDPADEEQAEFYAAAAVCADAVFEPLDVPVEVVTVREPVDTPCGVVDPGAPATQCAGTVYMTPAHLRDGEDNGRFPGRYLGVFLREYARAVLDAGGVAALVGATVAAGSSEDDVTLRAARQATCLAGAASGSLAGRGAVDDNITAEIRQRLTEVDAPEDAATWLDRGAQERRPTACNSWT